MHASPNATEFVYESCIYTSVLKTLKYGDTGFVTYSSYNMYFFIFADLLNGTFLILTHLLLFERVSDNTTPGGGKEH